MARRRVVGPGVSSPSAPRPHGFPSAPPFDPSAWAGDNDRDRALDYAEHVGPLLGICDSGALAWAAYTTTPDYHAAIADLKARMADASRTA